MAGAGRFARMSGWREMILVIHAEGKVGTCQCDYVLDSPKAAGIASGHRGAQKFLHRHRGRSR